MGVFGVSQNKYQFYTKAAFIGNICIKAYLEAQLFRILSHKVQPHPRSLLAIWVVTGKPLVKNKRQILRWNAIAVVADTEVNFILILPYCNRYFPTIAVCIFNCVTD